MQTTATPTLEQEMSVVKLYVHSPPACYASGAEGVVGVGYRRAVPGVALKVSAYQTCHRRLQQWVRQGKLELVLRLAAALEQRGMLHVRRSLERCDLPRSETGFAVGPTRRGKGTKIMPFADALRSSSRR